MKILAIETSTSACSVAININRRIQAKYKLAPQEVNQILLPMIEEILSEADILVSDLDAIAFGQGPGSFTGIRIAAAVTQGLAITHDIAVLPISTLLIMAQSAYRLLNAKHVLPCLDARMQAVYWAQCQLNQEQTLMEFVQAEQCTASDALTIPVEVLKKSVGVGNGWHSYPALKNQSQNLLNCAVDFYPHAMDLAVLAGEAIHQAKAPQEALPNYLRDMQYAKAR